MSDEQTRENEVVEETTQDSPESQVTETETDQTQEPDQKPSETETDAEVEQSTDDTNGVEEEAEAPKDNAAWAKLRVENKQLKKAVEQSGIDAEYLEMLKQANQPQEVDYQGYVQQDPNLQNDQAAKIGAQALQEVQSLKNQLEFEQDKRARDLYPEIFQNPALEALVAEKKLASRVLGKQRSTSDIAKEVADMFNVSVKQAQAQAVQQEQQRQVNKTQATAQPQTSTTAQAGSDDKLQQLKAKARAGDINAQTEVAKTLIADLNFD